MESFKLQGISFFICAFLDLIFTFLILKGMRKSKVRLHLGFLTLFSGLFALPYGIEYFFWESLTLDLKLFFVRATWIGMLMLPAFVIFTYHFTENLKHIKIKTLFFYSTGLVITFLSIFTPLCIKTMRPGAIPPFAGPEDLEKGLLEPIGRIYILFCVIVGLIINLKYYFKITGLKKIQARYFILGLMIYAIGGLITTGLIPLLFKSVSYTYMLVYISLIWVALSLYAILKHRLMDIRVVVGKMAIYIFSTLTLIAIALLVKFLNTKLGYFIPENIIFIIVLIISILIFQPLFRFFERIAGKYFYYTFYTLQTTLTDLSKKLNQIVELEKLTTLINRSLLDALKLDRVGIILKEPKGKILIPQQLIKFEKENITSLLAKEDNFLAYYLQKTKKALVREEIPFLVEKLEEEEKRKLNILKEEMEKNGIALILPLIIKEELIGMIIFGDKLSGEAYTIQDIDLLTTLSYQLSIALNNALSFAEIEKKKAELEIFYKAAVGRELKMIELKKKIKELEERYKK